MLNKLNSLADIFKETVAVPSPAFTENLFDEETLLPNDIADISLETREIPIENSNRERRTATFPDSWDKLDGVDLASEFLIQISTL